MPDPSDEELIREYRSAGSGRAANALLDSLFQRYHSRVALWCLRLTGDREWAADLAQDVFMKAFRNLDSYRGDSKFSTWLYSVARNHCFNEVKARAARKESTLEAEIIEPADPGADPYDLLEREGSVASMRELMRTTLTDVESRVMTLHYGEELPLDAVTRLVGLTNASGAKAYIVSAKRKLATVLSRRNASHSKEGR